MTLKLEFPTLHDDDIHQEADGTFTLSLEPWCRERIEGIPTKQMAREIAHVCHEAMRGYADNAMTEG